MASPDIADTQRAILLELEGLNEGLVVVAQAVAAAAIVSMPAASPAERGRALARIFEIAGVEIDDDDESWRGNGKGARR